MTDTERTQTEELVEEIVDAMDAAQHEHGEGTTFHDYAWAAVDVMLRWTAPVRLKNEVPVYLRRHEFFGRADDERICVCGLDRLGHDREMTRCEP